MKGVGSMMMMFHLRDGAEVTHQMKKTAERETGRERGETGVRQKKIRFVRKLHENSVYFCDIQIMNCM